MNPTKNPQIFIAHASEDKPKVRELYTRLKQSGLNPWLDEKDLLPGQNWRDEIPNALSKSDFFIACLSSQSVSKKGYIQREFKQALNLLAEMPTGTIYLIPLKLDDCEVPDVKIPQLGTSLRDLQSLNYWEPNAFENLVRAIEHQFRASEPEEFQKKASSSAKPESQASQKLGNQTTSRQILEFRVVTVDAQGEVIKKEKGQAQYFTEELSKDVPLEMIVIPEGTFVMGSPEGEEGSDDRERPQHQVTVKAFSISKYLITQAQWKQIANLPLMERNLDPDSSHFKGDDDDLPVEMINWYDAVEFCARLSRDTGWEYRLPSEAEWEYACRAGTITPFHFGETITTDLANYDGNGPFGSDPEGSYRKKTTPVGSFGMANDFGLYDMHGNVWEWCADHWHESYENAPSDGSVWFSNNKGAARLVRGGSWFDYSRYCRSASRDDNLPNFKNYNIGFRVVCSGGRLRSLLKEALN